MHKYRLEVVMRITLFSGLIAALFSGCIIVGEMPKGTWDDTGEPIIEADPADDERRFLVTPSEVTPGRGRHCSLSFCAHRRNTGPGDAGA